VYVTQKHQKLPFENKSMIVPIFVTKTVVKIIHEHEYSGKVRVVVIKEEGDYDTPTSVTINCFVPCFQQEYSRAIIQKTIINTPVFITTVNQITNIVNNVNTINSVYINNNNLINNAYVNNVNTDNMNILILLHHRLTVLPPYSQCLPIHLYIKVVLQIPMSHQA
jgi:hypothetical protein